MSVNKIVLILGAGPRIGAAVAEHFARNDYKVALASRTGGSKANTNSTTTNDFISLTADFTKPSTIPSLFSAVQAAFHAPPNVIIYNAGSLTPPPEKDDPLSIAAENVQKDFMVNVVTPYVAAHEATKAWAELPKDVKKTFIYTGNITNVAIVPMPLMVNVGMGKAAAAYWIGTADAAFKEKGYRFYYADERQADGRLKGQQLDGEAHAEFYGKLAAHEGEAPWHATFVKGQGYKKF